MRKRRRKCVYEDLVQVFTREGMTREDAERMADLTVADWLRELHGRTTAVDIGHILGVSRQRVQQIEKEAFELMRSLQSQQVWASEWKKG